MAFILERWLRHVGSVNDASIDTHSPENDIPRHCRPPECKFGFAPHVDVGIPLK
jgi:hypothetical protein